MNTRNEEFDNYNSLYRQVVKEEKIHFVETGGEPESESNSNEEKIKKDNENPYMDDSAAIDLRVNQYEIVNPDKTEIVKEAVQC